jgi:hypothetical protein
MSMSRMPSGVSVYWIVWSLWMSCSKLRATSARVLEGTLSSDVRIVVALGLAGDDVAEVLAVCSGRTLLTEPSWGRDTDFSEAVRACGLSTDTVPMDAATGGLACDASACRLGLRSGRAGAGAGADMGTVAESGDEPDDVGGRLELECLFGTSGSASMKKVPDVVDDESIVTLVFEVADLPGDAGGDA